MYLFLLVGLLTCMLYSCNKPVDDVEFKIIRNEFYYDNDTSCRLDVVRYIPIDTKKKLPVLIYVHGGGWNEGDKSEWNEYIGHYFLMKGIMSVSMNYSLSPKPVELSNPKRVMHPSPIKNVAKAVRWVRDSISTMGGDPQSIFLVGYSAGALLADLLVTNQCFLTQEGVSIHSLRGVISLDAGPYLTLDRNMLYPEVSPTPSVYNSLRILWENAFGKQNYNNIEINPLLNINAKKYIPPFMLLYGKDPLRSEANEEFAKSLVDNNHSCDIEMIDSFKHNDFLNLLGNDIYYSDRVSNFILKNKVH